MVPLVDERQSQFLTPLNPTSSIESYQTYTRAQKLGSWLNDEELAYRARLPRDSGHGMVPLVDERGRRNALPGMSDTVAGTVLASLAPDLPLPRLQTHTFLRVHTPSLDDKHIF